MSRVLLLLDHRENRRLLAEALVPHFEVITPVSDEALADNFDVGIVDGVALSRLGRQIEARKQKEYPVFLPFLFIASRRDVGMATNHLWKSIDDLIFSPIEKVELLARVRGVYERRRLSLEYHQFVLRASTNAIVLLNRVGHVVQWSPSEERIFGWSEAETLGKHPPCISEEEIFNKLLETVWLGEEFASGETVCPRKDGSIVHFTVAAAPLRDANGTITYAVCVISDVTESKRTLELQKRRLNELETLDHVTAVLRQARTVDEALPILLNETLAMLGFPAGCIWLHQPAENHLRVAAATGWFADLRETPIKPGEGIAGTVFASGRAHISPEFVSDAFLCPSDIERVPAGWGGACIPIHALETLVGVFFVSCPLPRQVQPDEIKLLESLTRMAGVTLQRMELYESTQRRARQLEALHEIDRAISGSMGLRAILDTLCRQAATELRMDAAGVLLLDPTDMTLGYAAGYGFRTSAYQHLRVRLGQGQAGLAALERKTFHCPDLRSAVPAFLRKELLENEGFLAYAVVPLIAKGNIKGVLEVFHRAPFSPDREWWGFLEKLALQGAIGIENAQLFESLERSNMELSLAYDATIEGWSRALDLRDKETEGHTLRVMEMTVRLARAAGMTDQELVHVRHGALLHDIGKMGVPDAILLKPDKLTDEEWVVMRQHPMLAYEMLSPIAYLRPALDIPYCHHEKWDGTGYPRGLKGEQIPLAARLFAVVDVWDALRSDRPYRLGWPEEKVREYIRASAGTHFDPKAVELFLKLISEMT
ncbi:MAG: histidine kinase [Anaerolineae bacterium]|nr:MAG: histidine kinase [Anaerolineae bacterium]